MASWCDGGYLFLECELDRIVDGFGDNALIVGRVVAARAEEATVRGDDREDDRVIHEAPLLAYLNPGRFAVVKESHSFPLPGRHEEVTRWRNLTATPYATTWQARAIT